MINKPSHDMRRGFWRADAWAAARAEKPGRWHTPYPENSVFSRVLVGFLLTASLLNGVTAFALCFAFFFGLAVVGNLLRRVLMYLSIRRYGPWREMAPEMRAIIENPSDLAKGPERFAPMPKGFTSTAGPAPLGRNPQSREAVLPVIFFVLCVLMLLLMD